ncbi:hypothetical protein CDIK_1578 [Cucumispora dikerogammari]|nr:hypothetical protein CDIK_1578 [Cucumispora dikerogammari]
MITGVMYGLCIMVVIKTTCSRAHNEEDSNNSRCCPRLSENTTNHKKIDDCSFETAVKNISFVCTDSHFDDIHKKTHNSEERAAIHNHENPTISIKAECNLMKKNESKQDAVPLFLDKPVSRKRRNNENLDVMMSKMCLNNERETNESLTTEITDRTDISTRNLRVRKPLGGSYTRPDTPVLNNIFTCEKVNEKDVRANNQEEYKSNQVSYKSEKQLVEDGVFKSDSYSGPVLPKRPRTVDFLTNSISKLNIKQDFYEDDYIDLHQDTPIFSKSTNTSIPVTPKEENQKIEIKPVLETNIMSYNVSNGGVYNVFFIKLGEPQSIDIRKVINTNPHTKTPQLMILNYSKEEKCAIIEYSICNIPVYCFVCLKSLSRNVKIIRYNRINQAYSLLDTWTITVRFPLQDELSLVQLIPNFVLDKQPITIRDKFFRHISWINGQVKNFNSQKIKTITTSNIQYLENMNDPFGKTLNFYLCDQVSDFVNKYDNHIRKSFYLSNLKGVNRVLIAFGKVITSMGFSLNKSSVFEFVTELYSNLLHIQSNQQTIEPKRNFTVEESIVLSCHFVILTEYRSIVESLFDIFNLYLRNKDESIIIYNKQESIN